MSKKQNNQTEQRLEEYARRRQGELGVPLDMHEATRTMLHGEVRRQYGPVSSTVTDTTEPAGFGWLGWALSGAAVGAVALTVSLNSGQTSKPAGASSTTVAEAQPGGTENETVRDDQSSENSGRAKSFKSGSGPSRVMAGGTAPSGVASANSAPGSPGVAVVQALPTQPRAKAGLVGRPGVVRLPNSYYNGLQELRQEFAQSGDVTQPNAKNALPKPVLVQFHVERNGQHVRVIDGDGSEYTGSVINEEEFADAKESAAKQENLENQTPGLTPAAIPPPTAPAVAQVRVVPLRARRAPRGQFFFRASGMNKTLRQRVIIEATFNHPVEKKLKEDAGVVRQAKSPSAQPLQPLSPKPNIQAVRAIARMRVLGNARIGKANYPVDAYQQATSNPAKPAAVNPAPLNKAGKK